MESLYHLFLLSSRIQIRSESASTIHSPVRDDCLGSRNESVSTWMTFVSSFMFHLDCTVLYGSNKLYFAYISYFEIS